MRMAGWLTSKDGGLLTSKLLFTQPVNKHGCPSQLAPAGHGGRGGAGRGVPTPCWGGQPLMMGRNFGNIALENGEDNSLRWRAPFFKVGRWGGQFSWKCTTLKDREYSLWKWGGHFFKVGRAVFDDVKDTFWNWEGNFWQWEGYKTFEISGGPLLKIERAIGQLLLLDHLVRLVRPLNRWVSLSQPTSVTTPGRISSIASE